MNPVVRDCRAVPLETLRMIWGTVTTSTIVSSRSFREEEEKRQLTPVRVDNRQQPRDPTILEDDSDRDDESKKHQSDWDQSK